MRERKFITAHDGTIVPEDAVATPDRREFWEQRPWGDGPAPFGRTRPRKGYVEPEGSK